MAVITLEIVEIETDKVVNTIDVSNKTESGVDRVLRGLLRQADLDRFVIREVTDEKEER